MLSFEVNLSKQTNKQTNKKDELGVSLDLVTTLFYILKNILQTDPWLFNMPKFNANITENVTRGTRLFKVLECFLTVLMGLCLFFGKIKSIGSMCC